MNHTAFKFGTGVPSQAKTHRPPVSRHKKLSVSFVFEVCTSYLRKMQ